MHPHSTCKICIAYENLYFTVISKRPILACINTNEDIIHSHRPLRNLYGDNIVIICKCIVHIDNAYVYVLFNFIKTYTYTYQ